MPFAPIEGELFRTSFLARDEPDLLCNAGFELFYRAIQIRQCIESGACEVSSRFTSVRIV